MRIHAYASRATALLFAALAPTGAYFAIGSSQWVAFVFVIALAHTVLLGLPTFLLGRSLIRVNLISSAVVGFAIGAVPISLLMLLTWDSTGSAPNQGLPTIIDGGATLVGWLYHLVPGWGAAGALGGMTFFLILKLTGGATRAGDETAAPVTRRASLATSGLAVVALLLAGTAFAIPRITMDRSCHNTSRAPTSVGAGPRVQAALVIPVEDWPRLTRLFEEFGAANGLSFRNGNFDRPGTIRALNLRLCNDRGLSIHVFGEHWERGGGVSALRTDGIFLGISELRDGSDWQHPARALIGELETHWPGSVHQRKEGSRAIFPFAPDQLQETK